LLKQNEKQEEKPIVDSNTTGTKSKKEKPQDKSTPAGPVVTKILTRKKETEQNDVNYSQLAEIFSKKDESQASDVRKDPSFKLILKQIHETQKGDTEITSKQDESQSKDALSDIESINDPSGKRSQVINFRQLDGDSTIDKNNSNGVDLPDSQNNTTEKSSKKKKKKSKKEKKEKKEKEVDTSLSKTENEVKSKSKKVNIFQLSILFN
jgi:hypothetical protein